MRKSLIRNSATGFCTGIGQNLQPYEKRLPVERYVTPEEFAEWKKIGEAMGFKHVESSPLTRSSYHAREQADSGNR